MKKKIIITSFALLLTLSCTKQNNTNTTNNTTTNNIEIIDFDKAMSENVIESFNDYIDSVYLVPLETNDNCFVRNCYKTIISDDRIIIFDIYNPEHQVLIFDSNGKFINSIKRGSGPSEIIKAYDIAYDYDKEEIIASQYSSQSHFTKDGVYIKNASINFLFYQFAIYNNEYIFKMSNHQRNEELGEFANHNIIVTDNNYNITQACLPFFNELEFVSTKEIYYKKEGVYLTFMMNDTIFVYKDKTISPAFILKYSDKKYDKIPQNCEIEEQTENNSGYCYEESFEDCDSHQFLCIDNNKEDLFAYLIRNKNTKNCICKIIPRKDFFNGCRTYVIPCASYNDFFVRCLSQENIEENKKNIEPFLSEKDKAVLNNFKDEDNPILMFYRFKDF